MQLQYADILKAYLLLLLWGGHLGFQVTLTLDSQNNIFIQSDSLDLVGIYLGDIHLINPSRSSTFQVIVNLG